jgi:hypothetical protein
MRVQKANRTPKRSTKTAKSSRPVQRTATQSSSRESRTAFLRAFPQLARQPELDRKWVLFVGEQQFGAGNTKLELIRLCQRRKIPPGHYYIGFVDSSDSREDVERIDSPNCL